MALGAIVSASELTICDVCGKQEPGSAYRPRPPWVAVEVRGSGVWASTQTHHACSKECTARLFYKLADLSGGIPAANVGKSIDPKTGQPYR